MVDATPGHNVLERLGQAELDGLLEDVGDVERGVEVVDEPAADLGDEVLGGRGAGGEHDCLDVLEPVRVDGGDVVDEPGGRARGG